MFVLPLRGLLDAVFGPPGGLLGPLGGLLGASWGHLGNFRWLLARLTPAEAVSGVSLGRLGALLERFRAVLGPSWGPLGGLLGNLGVMLG
mgnify:FL=1